MFKFTFFFHHEESKEWKHVRSYKADTLTDAMQTFRAEVGVYARLTCVQITGEGKRDELLTIGDIK